MSLYNELALSIRCPHCGTTSAISTQVQFGLRNFIEYRVGDLVQWLPRKAVRNGGRPDGGDLDAEAYAVCPACGKDFIVTVRIRADRIDGAISGTERPVSRG
jgi:hypothetical protein